jgi:glycopeptide antibiotics resistance protein
LYYSIQALLRHPATLVAVAGAVVLALVFARRLGQKFARPTWLAAASLMSISGIIAVTLTPASSSYALGSPANCVRSILNIAEGFSLLRDGNDVWANILLFMPAGFLLATLTRRPGLTISGLVVLSGLIETFQGEIGRSCTATDWLANSLGAGAGAAVAAGLLLLGWVADRRAGQSPETSPQQAGSSSSAEAR